MNIRLHKEDRSTVGKLFDVRIAGWETEFTGCRELFKYSFPIHTADEEKRYEECKEKFEEWLKESELEDSIKNSIKIAFYDKNILYASIGHPIRQLQN